MGFHLKYLVFLFYMISFPPLNKGEKLDFTGKWILNFEKSKLQDISEGQTGSVFLIKQDGDKFSLKIVHIFGAREKKIGFKMIADGKTRSVKVLFKGKLEEFENGLRASLWRSNFSNIVDYEFGKDKNELIANEKFKSSTKTYHNIWVFDREILK